MLRLGDSRVHQGHTLHHGCRSVCVPVTHQANPHCTQIARQREPTPAVRDARPQHVPSSSPASSPAALRASLSLPFSFCPPHTTLTMSRSHRACRLAHKHHTRTGTTSRHRKMAATGWHHATQPTHMHAACSYAHASTMTVSVSRSCGVVVPIPHGTSPCPHAHVPICVPACVHVHVHHVHMRVSEGVTGRPSSTLHASLPPRF